MEQENNITVTKTSNPEESQTIKVPIYNIPILSDERWNQLAYMNRLARRCY